MRPEEEQFFLEMLKHNPTREIILQIKSMIRAQTLPTYSYENKVYFKVDLWKGLLDELLVKESDRENV